MTAWWMAERWLVSYRMPLSVSNSLSGRHGELDHVPAVGDLTDIVQLDTGHHVSADEGQRRVALQPRVAAYLVGGGQTPRNVASILDSARELGIRDGQASFSLGVAGAFWKLGSNDPVGAVLSAGGALLSLRSRDRVNTGAYSYLFRAHSQFPY